VKFDHLKKRKVFTQITPRHCQTVYNNKNITKQQLLFPSSYNNTITKISTIIHLIPAIYTTRCCQTTTR